MKRAALAIACAAAAACTLLEPTEGGTRTASVAPPHATRARDPLVSYLAELRGMNEASLGREIARQRQLSAKEGTDLARTRLALALSLSPQADEGEILGLTDPVARKDTTAADVRAMASFLHVMASERRRLKESAAAANAKLREERRAVEAQKQRADTMQERAAQLQQKIDALTELEKSLSDRSIPGH